MPLYDPIALFIPEDALDPRSPKWDPTKALECTGQDERPNFDSYSLGLGFEGLPLTARLRTCEPSRPPIAFRANYVTYIYGDCDPWAGIDPAYPRESGASPDPMCAPPVEVQSWPICERNPARYVQGQTDELHLATSQADEQFTVRGSPAAVYDGGEVLEVYAGTTTIAIFGDDLAQMKRAAQALVRVELPPGPLIGEGPTTGTAADDVSADDPLPAPMPGGIDNSAACGVTGAYLEAVR